VRVGESTAEVQTMTLLVSPLTGKVVIKSGPVELKLPVDQRDLSDRPASLL
jgi:hypothetical protein